jgi:hypothetical protein
MSDPRLDRIGRLAAIARGLEREGAYNGAKLLRAALEQDLIRYAEAEAPAGLDATADALASLVSDGGGEPAAWRERLPLVERRARAHDAIRLADVPPIRLCRVCGELFIGLEVPATCPACEAPALSFREILPTWYLEPAEPGTILAQLAAGPGHVVAALAGRDDAALDEAPAVGEWSARETLQHLVFTEALLATRVGRLLTEEEPDLAAWVVVSGTAPDEGVDATDAPASALVARYRSLRHQTVERLRDLDEASWGRGGNHPEWGRITLLGQAAYFARHEASHLAQLVAAAEGRLPGRR